MSRQLPARATSLGVLAVVIAAVAGIVIAVNGHIFVGVMIAMLSLPLGLFVWMSASDRA